MATSDPFYNDKIIAKAGGATLYGDKNRTPWLWDKKPVMLTEGDFLYSTGWTHRDGTKGAVYEVYIWRRSGNKQFYKSKEEAKVGFFDGGAFLWSNINYEIRYIAIEEATVAFAAANDGAEPAPTSPATQEKNERQEVENRLGREVYNLNPDQPVHTSLVKDANGKWIVGFKNGYSADLESFLKLTPDKRLTLTTAVPTPDGFTGKSGSEDGIKEVDTIPMWIYVLLGGISVIGFVFLMFQSQGKKKK